MMMGDRGGHRMSGFDPSASPTSLTHSTFHPSSPMQSPPPNGYITTADITQRPYEGERSLAAILHMDEIVPHVLSFLSTVELLFVQSVNHSWLRHTSTARGLIHRLHLGQFWSRIGHIDTSHFIHIASTFPDITELNLAYCNFMTGPIFSQILHAIPTHTRITKLNLFYCYQLTDDDIESLMNQTTLPNLRELNLGRVSKLTNRSVRALADLKSLTYLNLIHNPNIDEETLMLFDDLTKFPSLQILNLMFCSKYRMEDIEELVKTCQANGRNQQLQKMGGNNIRFIGPQELFQIDKSGKKMRKDIDADT